MSFIAAVLILNLDTADAFIAFSNLLNKPCQMAFFRVDHGLVSIPRLCALALCLITPSFPWEKERAVPLVRRVWDKAHGVRWGYWSVVLNFRHTQLIVICTNF